VRCFTGDEWWFSVIGVVGVFSESDNPKRYWSDLKTQNGSGIRHGSTVRKNRTVEIKGA